MIIIENVNHISFPVSNIEKSLEFYRDVFFFDSVERPANKSEAFLQIGDMSLRLCETKKILPASEENYICFAIDKQDFEDAIDELEDKEIKILYGPADTSNGKIAILADPDGNRIGLSYNE
jgi:catechol 2,3-dioxygenase-like lactoylglutathione lyase family enzyme